MGMLMSNLLLLPIVIALPAIVLYFVIKLSIKSAIKDLKNESVL